MSIPDPIRQGLELVRVLVHSYEEEPSAERAEVDAQIAGLRRLIEETYVGQPKPREIRQITEELDLMTAKVDSLAHTRLRAGAPPAGGEPASGASEAAAMAAAMAASMSSGSAEKGSIIRTPKSIEQYVYNDRMHASRMPKLESLGAQFSHILPVRGEGDCYYRSFYMGALLNNRPHVLTRAIDQFRAAMTPADRGRFSEEKLKALELLLHDMSQLTPRALTEALSKADHPFDREMVSFLRAYAAQGLEQAPAAHPLWGGVEYDSERGETAQDGMKRFVADAVLKPQEYATGMVIARMHERMGVNVPIVIYNADKTLFSTGDPDLDNFGCETGGIALSGIDKEPDFYLYQSGGADSGHYDVPIMRNEYGFDIAAVTVELQRLERCTQDASKTFGEGEAVRNRLQEMLPPLTSLSGNPSYVNSVLRAYRLVDRFSLAIEQRTHRNFDPFVGALGTTPVAIEILPKDLAGTKFEGMPGDLVGMIRDFQSNFSQFGEDGIDAEAFQEVLTNFVSAIGDKANQVALSPEQRAFVESFVSSRLYALKNMGAAMRGQEYDLEISHDPSLATNALGRDSLEAVAYGLEVLKAGDSFDAVYRLTHTLNIAFSADVRARVIELYNANPGVTHLDSPDDRAKPISHPDEMRKAVQQAVRERVPEEVYGRIYELLGSNDRGEGMSFGQNHLFDGRWLILSQALRERGATFSYLE